MPVIAEIESWADELAEMRRDIHAHPELAYEEERTAGIVARELERAGLAVVTGIARTGVVGSLVNGEGPAVGLRADMDALPIIEANEFAYRSRYEGKMHACGHDGHTTMLIGAARYLAHTRDFTGTIHFIFQPAEEAAGGAKVMIDEGLFERFPVDAVFGMHNWPGLEAGSFAMRNGPMMASLDCFDVRIEGRGTHGALPHRGIDPIAVAAAVIESVQSIVSRNVDPLRAAVISITRIQGGDAYNIIPPAVELAGGIRAFEPELRSWLRGRLEQVVTGIAGAYGASAEVRFSRGHPAVINDGASTALAAEAAAAVVGGDRVDASADPVLGSEDFAYMLERRPGSYVFIGNGAGESAGSCTIHNPGYDFNDAIIPLGASYWVELARTFLARGRA